MKTVDAKKCLKCGQYFYPEDSGLNPKSCRCKPAHTPTPWFAWGTDHQGRRPTISSKAPGNGYSVSSEIATVKADEDAAFIVLAVNAHQGFIDVLEALKSDLETGNFNPRGAVALIDSFLAKEDLVKAEGK